MRLEPEDSDGTSSCGTTTASEKATTNLRGTRQPPQPQIVIISRHIFSDGWHGFCVRFHVFNSRVALAILRAPSANRTSPLERVLGKVGKAFSGSSVRCNASADVMRCMSMHRKAAGCSIILSNR